MLLAFTVTGYSSLVSKRYYFLRYVDIQHHAMLKENRYAAYKNWTDGTALPMIPQYNCSIWAENNVIWADMNGLLNGLGVDITDMTAKASRAELAAYLARFYKAFAEN